MKFTHFVRAFQKIKDMEEIPSANQSGDIELVFQDDYEWTETQILVKRETIEEVKHLLRQNREHRAWLAFALDMQRHEINATASAKGWFECELCETKRLLMDRITVPPSVGGYEVQQIARREARLRSEQPSRSSRHGVRLSTTISTSIPAMSPQDYVQVSDPVMQAPPPNITLGG